MPNPSLRCGLLLIAVILCAACTTMKNGYRTDPVSLAPPEKPAQDDKGMYLELIAQMQRQGAYYASLAHVEAYRQRYGDVPTLRLLQADALRETGQVAAAQALYTALSSGPQAAAAWHGRGLIAARGNDPAQAEQALARAVQLQPLNTDFLGDLGFARLRAGHLDQAREPLAKAAELAPGNVKANANLAVWALLRNDTAMAERIMQSAALPAPAREEIQRLAQQLRQPTPPPTPAPTPTPTAAATTAPPPSASVPTAPAPEHPAPVSARDTRSVDRARVPVAVETPRAPRGDARLAPSMLERFGGPDHANESTP